MRHLHLAVLLALASSASAQIINGDFEGTPWDNGWNDGGTTVNPRNGEPGTGPGGGVGVAACFATPAPGGGGWGSQLGQVFDCGSTNPAMNCVISFSYWCQPGARLKVTAGAASFEPGAAFRDSTWRHASITTDCGSVDLLILGSGTVAGDEVCVDNFSSICTTAPEPASMAALGLGAVALIRRKRKSN